MLNSAIVGCGSIASVHAKVLSHLPGVTLIACADCKLEKAENMATEYKCHAYSNLQEMIAHEKIDVLHICTPHYLHTPMVKTAIENGIAVFTEKPPVISREQLEEFFTLNQKGRIGICFQNRYNKNNAFAKELITSKKAGKLLGARAFVTWKRDRMYYEESDWRGQLSMEGGGVLINQAIHTLDLLIWLAGKPEIVEATTSNHHLKSVMEEEDTVEAYLQYKDAQAIFYATNAYAVNAPVFLEIACEHMTIRLTEDSVELLYVDGRREMITFPVTETSLGKDYWGNGHYLCIKDYYEKLNLKQSAPIKIEDVKDTIDVMLKIYESAKREKH